MKHLIKNIAVLSISILFILLSIKSSYAGETNLLKSITATSTKTIELELEQKINKVFTSGDLEIYKSIDNKITKVEGENNKILLELTSPIEENTSYSLISISAIEGNIIFKTGDDILLKEIENTVLESSEEGIKNILIKDRRNVVLTFYSKYGGYGFRISIIKNFRSGYN
ncbi:MAG: hypothetical protein Q9M97_01710 [Candidatus Gracilibacteria bacterium]|nr:hypothetical protein [Candidatus Gracilibacteria bacterium]